MFSSDFSCSFSDYLRFLLSESGLTQRAFSDLIGCPLRTLEDWLSGRRLPPVYVCEAILERVSLVLERKSLLD